MGKLTAILTYDRFSKLLAQNKINDRSLNFILDTGQLYTHGIFLNSVAYGTEANGAILLIVAGTTKTLSLSSHTHSTYLEKNANINLGSYKIVSGQKDLLYYSGGNTYLGDITTPTIILGTSLNTVRNNTTYTILDTGNFSIGNTISAGYTLLNVAVFKYGSSTYQLDYVKRINTSSTFDTLATYTNAGTTLVNGKQHGILTFYTDGTTNSPSWAQIRVNIPDKLVEFRTSAASTDWITLNPPTINNNAKNVAGIVAAPPVNTNYNVWMTDNAQNPAWRSASVNNPTLAWGEEATIGTLGALTFKVTMPSNPNTDYTGIKLGTVTGTKKTDSTLLKALSSTGLIVLGGTNLFKIGNGTNYIEVSVKHGLSTKNISINGTNYAIYTSESSLPTIIAPTSLGSAGQVLTVDSNANGLSWTTLTNTNVTTSAVVASQSTGTTLILADLTDPFYNLIEGSTITRSIQFKAGTGLTIKSNANGVITFTNSSPASGLSTKNININGTNYAVYTSANSLPSFVAPTSLARTGGQILATNSNKTGLEWVAKPVNSWRNIRINDDDSDLLSTGTGSGALYIKQGTGITVSWTNGKLIITNASPNVWKAANTSLEGYIPKLVTGGGTITSTDSVYVLAYKSGISGTTTPTWLQLPANAYLNDNTWRGIQDNLTSSTNTTESLSAKQGYLLANGYARDSSKQFAYNFGGTGSTTKIKISINTTVRYMLSFVVTLYLTYRSTKIMVSGYNNASNYWRNPKAVILGDTDSSTVNVYFGYDGLDQLWVGFNGGSYTGVCITDVCNGYNQITPSETLFTITNVSEFGGTTLNTVTPVNPYLNTWQQNTATQAGYVPAPGTNVSGKVWMTGSDGTPSWLNANNHSHSYLPLSGANYNTSTDTNPFTISRSGGTTEAMLVMLNDNRTLFKYTNDEASSSIVFQLVNTDTESGKEGASASDRNVTITSNNTGISLSVGGTLVSLNGHKHAYTDITGSGTTANMALVSTTTANTLAFKLLGSNAFNSTAYLPLAGGTMTADSAISWGNNDRTDWDTYVTGLKIISSTTNNSGSPTRYSTALSVVGRYGFLIAALGGDASAFYIRNTGNGTWRVLLHEGNYTSYKHAYTNLTGSGTIADQAIVSTGTANGWTLKTLGSNAFNSTSYLPLSGGKMTGHITMGGLAIYFGKNGSNAIMCYDASYPNYGIWYHDETVDKMSFSASNNANDCSAADLCINGNGAGTVTIRGNTIYHTGNLGVMVKSGSNHASGLVPDPGATEGTTKFLCEDGTWKTPTYTSDTNTWREIKVNGTLKRSTNVTSGDLDFINGSNTTVEWTSENKLKINSTWNAMTGATASANGTTGYINVVPPKNGYNTKFLRADGTWSVPAYPTKSSWNYDDKYITFVGITDDNTNHKNQLRYVLNGSSNYFTVPFASASSSTMILNSSSLSNDADIIQEGIRAYTGSGTNWVGSVASMAYAAILTFGYPSRGWLLWAARGSGSLIWRNGTNDLTGWNDERIILDSANYTSYVKNNTFSIKSKIGSATAVTLSDFTANQSSDDDFTLILGTNITFTNNTTNRTLTIASKDTWIAWSGASSTNGGTAGYMPAPGTANYQKFLRGDGTWCSLSTPDDTTTLTRASGNLTKDTWSDVGTFANTVAEGTWVISFTIDGSLYSGVFSRKKGDTMNEEIDLHAAGTSAKRIYARTTGNKILIATSDATFNPGAITFNFRKLI